MTNTVYMIFVYLTVLFLTLIFTMTDAVAGEEKYGPMIREVALEHGINPDLALAIAEVESGFNPDAIGSLGEVGIFQLRPEFHPVVKDDTRHNARLAIRYLVYVRRACSHKYGDRFWVCYSLGPYRKKIKEIEKLPYFQKVNDALQRRQANEND